MGTEVSAFFNVVVVQNVLSRAFGSRVSHLSR